MAEELRAQYRRRFEAEHAAREKTWRLLVDHWFNRYLEDASDVLDLGCGWGSFINKVSVPHRYAIDLNPDAAAHVDPGVQLFQQSSADRWPLSDASLDVVFTSNFLEHLPSREAVTETLAEAQRCLRSGGSLVAMGPNIRFTGGKYWDFFDHIIPITDRSLSEVMELVGFDIVETFPRFLPFTMAGRKAPSALAIKAYLRLRPAWRVFGEQFLLVARK